MLRLEAIMVFIAGFWLNGHMDSACVSAQNCNANDIQWEDGGPGFDESIYEGWMGMNIDNRERSCLQVMYHNERNIFT